MRALTRLRIGFGLLGAFLLLPLFFLLREAEARFESQRKLRHEIVAERVFDEMERELTGLLEVERARPSDAYDAADTSVGAWSPFVVGYFRWDGSQVALTADAQLGTERSQRVRDAVAAVQTEGALARLLGSKDGTGPIAAPERDDRRSNKQYAIQQQVDVLRKLNRARQERETSATKGSSPTRQRVDANQRKDPFWGL